MALFHLSVTQTKRSAGQSAIASAAYRAGERLYSEYYGEYSDYTRKGGVICSDILLPSHAPPEYADRQTLWNAVEKAERGKNAQLAYSFDIALQNEFSLEENIALARQFLLENFVSRGMVVDFAVHQPDREDGGIPNPHFHVLCPIRPIEQNGKWGLKQRRVYELDEDGNRILDADGKFVFNAVPTTDWGSPETLEYWRQTWAELCNAKFAEKGLTFVSTTEAMSVRAWSFFPPSTRRNRPGNGEERHTHREGRVQPLDQGNQCRYPEHQEENRSPVRLDCRSKSRACQAAGIRPCFSAERLLHPAQSRGVFAERQGQQSKGDERDFQLSPGKRHLLP